MYRSLDLDLAGCAKLLHVTERTLHNWESGKHDIPYATYRLLRLLNRMELPGDTWSGWCFHGGKLWSPEGRSFVGTDGSWWSLLVRRAACFDAMFQRTGQLEKALVDLEVNRRTIAANAALEGPDAARTAGGVPVGEVPAGSEVSSHPALAGGRREAPALDLSISHICTDGGQFGSKIGPVAIKFKLAPANQSTFKGVGS